MIPGILIAGVGNILLQDDGFGPQAVVRLQAEYEFGEDVELLDIGTPTLDFVDYLRGREVLILIDALSGGGEPGEILTFDKEQLKSFLPNMRLSAHQSCLHETLHAAELAGITLSEVLLVGVVGRHFDVTTELGPELSAAMPDVLNLVADFVRRRGVVVDRRVVPLPTRAWWEQGTFESRGEATMLNMKLDRQNMPVTDLEAAAPGVRCCAAQRLVVKERYRECQPQHPGSGGGSMKIPFAIEGTTSDPKFIPDTGAIAKSAIAGAAQSQLKGAVPSDAANALGGLFGKKTKKK